MAAPELLIPRETAEETAPLREVAEGRTFTEGETYALVADNVQRETAGLVAEKAALESEITTLKAEKAALETERDVALAAKEKAEQDFQAYKDAEAEKAQLATRREERLAKVKEVAKHLKDDFFSDERADRWAAMETAEFDSYVADLTAASAGAASAPATVTAEVASDQSSMSGAPVERPTSKTFFDLLGRES